MFIGLVALVVCELVEEEVLVVELVVDVVLLVLLVLVDDELEEVVVSVVAGGDVCAAMKGTKRATRIKERKIFMGVVCKPVCIDFCNCHGCHITLINCYM